jgi:hypothetical protein
MIKRGRRIDEEKFNRETRRAAATITARKSGILATGLGYFLSEISFGGRRRSLSCAYTSQTVLVITAPTHLGF